MNTNGHEKTLDPAHTEEPSSDPFNPEALRLSQDFHEQAGVKKLLTTVHVRRPDRQWFARVHPDKGYRLDTAVLELKEEREIYLTSRDLWDELPGEITPVTLFTAINRQGVLFLWPCKLPREDGRALGWQITLLEAAEHAMSKWVRVQANMSLGAYEVYVATGELPDPIWPELGFGEILKIAFKDRFIDSADHQVIKRLQGAI